MFTVSAEETTALTEAEGMRLVSKLEKPDGALKRPGVSWVRLAFERERE
jgi:hypothetical protein